MHKSIREPTLAKKIKIVVLTIFIVSVIFFIINFVKVYTLLFENQIAFIYNPPIDSFFVVEVEPIILPIYKWQYLNPFKSIEYGQVDNIQYKGRLSVAISQMEKFYKIKNENSELFSEKLASIEKKSFERLQELFHELDFSYIYCWKRLELDPEPLIPEAWKTILANVEKGEKGGLFVADVLLMRVTKNGPREITRLPNSLIVKPPAAGKLINFGFDEYIMFDEIW